MLPQLRFAAALASIASLATAQTTVGRKLHRAIDTGCAGRTFSCGAAHVSNEYCGTKHRGVRNRLCRPVLLLVSGTANYRGFCLFIARFCRPCLPYSGYAVSAWYIYRAIAPAGFQITNIYLTYAGVEANYDYCVVRNATVTSWSSTASVLKAYSANTGTVSFGPYAGNYGGVVQFDLFSESSNTNTGCRWTFRVSACPIGSFCSTGASSATPCPAGTFGASIGLFTSACSGVCTAGWFCPPGSTTSTAVVW